MYGFEKPPEVVGSPVGDVFCSAIGQYGHSWAVDRSRPGSSVQLGSRGRLGDGPDAVTTVTRRLEVCNAAVSPGGGCSVDGGLLADDVGLLLIQVFIHCRFWSLEPGCGGGEGYS